jgi:iron(III) transport system substrate-binding protein
MRRRPRAGRRFFFTAITGGKVAGMRRLCLPALLLLALIGCRRSSPAKEVVLYTSIDEPVARPILDAFMQQTGIKVVLKTDTEASKTAGLVETLRAEKANPQADVFWNNEPFHTINLAEEGALAAYDSPAAKDVLAPYKDPQHRWAANGLRMRMIAMAPGVSVSTVEDLTDPKFKGKLCIANPAFGTTSGHIAALFVKWGPEKAEKFMRDLKANDVRLLGGNSEVVKQIAGGNFAAGLTDNDDVDSMIAEGGKLTGVPADLRDHSGPLAIPCTVGLVSGAKHDAEAKKLIDYLLSPEVEAKMLAAHFAVRSARPQPTSQPGLPLIQVDYAEVAKMMPRAVDLARKIFEGRE